MKLLKKTIVLFLFYQSLFGCGGNKKDAFLHENINNALEDRDVADINVRDLTNFDWQEVCFSRNEEVTLKFIDKDVTRIYKYSYDKYYIDENYVKGSLDGVCLDNNKKITLMRKYPGYSDLIEFKKYKNDL